VLPRQDSEKTECGQKGRMRHFCVLAFFICALCSASPGQHEDWLPVSPLDWQIQDVPGDAGAPAIQLYYADFRDDSRQHQFIYSRVKVLTEQGRRFANVEIPVPPYAYLTELKARTLHADGSIVEFRDRPFERIVRQTLDSKTVVESFTLPAVTPGSIIEYKYSYSWDKYLADKTWEIQHELYTVRENFSIRPFTGSLNGTKHFEDDVQLSYVYSNLPEGVKPKDTGALVELEVERIPAFKPEESMPPPDNYRALVRFFYGGREISSPDSFWQEHARDWFTETERFIGNHQEIRKIAAEAMGAETDLEKKLRKLYVRTQEIRNLSFERQRTRSEGRTEELRPNRNAADVATHGYGSANDIARFFVALARSSGVQADILRASSRKDFVFDANFLSAGQLETELAVVKMDGKDTFLDPGTRFCPFGLVHWTHTSVPALRLNRNGGMFIVVPTPAADKAIRRRSVKATLKSDGTLAGDVTLELKGGSALQSRLEALETDDAGKLKILEETLGEWQTGPAKLSLTDTEGWELSEAPLLAHFTFEIPEYARRSGKRLLTPAALFQTKPATALTHAERKYPVYFPYTFEEIDKVDMQHPDGIYPDTLPASRDEKLASARFITQRTEQSGHLVLSRALVVNSIYFPAENYRELRDFFDRLRLADEEQIILTSREITK
jgi:transglutaminase-like putative cysteine protease